MLEGKFLKIAEGRLAYEIFEAESDYLKTVHTVLTKQFGFHRKKLWGLEMIIGLSEVIYSYERAGLQLEVGWVCWSGCYLFANQEAGDEVVRAIGAYLEELLRHA